MLRQRRAKITAFCLTSNSGHHLKYFSTMLVVLRDVASLGEIGKFSVLFSLSFLSQLFPALHPVV